MHLFFQWLNGLMGIAFLDYKMVSSSIDERLGSGKKYYRRVKFIIFFFFFSVGLTVTRLSVLYGVILVCHLYHTGVHTVVISGKKAVV